MKIKDKERPFTNQQRFGRKVIREGQANYTRNVCKAKEPSIKLGFVLPLLLYDDLSLTNLNRPLTFAWCITCIDHHIIPDDARNIKRSEVRLKTN